MAAKKEKVTKDNFEDLLLKSASEAVAYTKEETTLAERYVSLIEEPPEFSKTRIKKVRSKLGVSQAIFAKIFGESLSAIQHWEQGRRNMPKPARRLLDLIEKDPETVFELITSKKAS
ncbi:MAG: type II toxin-antitoxin system MqsA family antitoxin [Bacteriovoracaceae bacterium]|nr:type II toxin-antitoxin system MqsA family antitoxin [Bacteriovoracaceae bacterium]